MAKAIADRPPGRPGDRAPGASWARSWSPTWTRLDNHRRLGELRAASSSRRWPTSASPSGRTSGTATPDMMGTEGNRDPRKLLAGRPRRGGAATGLPGLAVSTGRADDLQRLRRLWPSRPHPDPRCGRPGLREGRRPGPYPEQLARSTAARADGRGGLVPWAPSKLYEPGHPGLGPRARDRTGSRRRAALVAGRAPRSGKSPARALRRKDARARRGHDHLDRRLGRPDRAKWAGDPGAPDAAHR